MDWKADCKFANTGASISIFFSFLARVNNFIAHKMGVQEDSCGVWSSTFCNLRTYLEIRAYQTTNSSFKSILQNDTIFIKHHAH